MSRMERCPEKAGEQGAASAVNGDAIQVTARTVIKSKNSFFFIELSPPM